MARSEPIDQHAHSWATRPNPDGFELGKDGPSVVVVGLDADQLSAGAPQGSMHALAYAAGLARRAGGRVVTVWVRPAISISDTFVDTRDALLLTRQARADGVQRTLQALAEDLNVEPLELVVRDGDPVDQLTSVADEVHADAIVVGASEHRLGSLAIQLVRDARWPVTVVP